MDRTVKAPSDRKRRVGWTRTKNSVGLEWASNRDISDWEISTPDKQKIKTTKDYFVDNSTAASGTYLITGSDPDGGIESFVLTIPEASSASSTIASATAEGSDQWRAVAWAAFIEENKVQAKLLGVPTCTEYLTLGYDSYGGDNRDFVDTIPDLYTTDTRRFRVGSAVASNWRGSAWVNPTIYDNLVSKETGITTAYDENGQLLQTAQANAQNDVTLESGFSEILPPNLGDLGAATRIVKMDSSNPLCNLPNPNPPHAPTPAPAISVDYDYRHTSNGWVSVEASHDKAPMHEVLWAAADDESNPAKPSGCLYRFRNQGFLNLSNTPVNNADVTLDFNPDVSAPSCVTV
ncbi:hypothetical protein [Janibacter alittae]|uniref:Uncharacterized protein n=1 Tax=Janibacter alittae TaxID=3115209 RepID=A0ABZ2MDN4_9MICO